MCKCGITNAQNNKDLKPKLLAFNAYTLQNGLSNSHINAINQDSKGFIWIATNDGLNRFDGLNFETFYSLPDDINSLPSSTINDIANGKDGTIWIATFEGLCSYDYKTSNFTRYNVPETFYPLQIKKLISTNDSTLWLVTSGGGIIKMDINTQNFTTYRHIENANSICSNLLLSAAIDNRGYVWLGSEDNGISVFNPDNQTFKHLNVGNGMLKSNCVLSLFYYNDNMYIGTFNGGLTVYNITNQKVTNYTTSKEKGSIGGNIVYSTVASNDGHIFIGTQDGGLQVFDTEKKTFDTFSNKNKNTLGLISDNIHSIFFDKDNNLWLGIFQGGLNQLKNKPVFDLATYNPQSPETSLPQKTVLSIYPLQNQKIMVGTDGGGLCFWDTTNNTFENIKAEKTDLKSDIIRSVYQGHDKKIWIGTYLSGLQLYNPETKKFTTFQNNPDDSCSLSHNDVTAITEDRLGNLWVATNGGGLNLMDKNKGTFQRFMKVEGKSNSLINNYITCLYLDKRGYLWIETFWGLSRFDPLRYEFKNLELQQTKSNSYYCIKEDVKQRLWAGTSNGIYLIDQEKGVIKTFTTRDGLPNNVINAIEEDNFGNLWISTNNGICRFNYDKNTIRNFSKEDGLQSNEFVRNAYAKTQNGELLFGGINGINKFLPENITTNTTAPSILLTDLLIFNKSVPVGEMPDGEIILNKNIIETENITLSHNYNSFTVEFKAIDYIEPQKIKYAVRMKEFNPDWIFYNYKQNSATFTNLDAGTYHLEIKAANADDVWCQPKVLTITILAPIYKRWYAKLFYAIVSILTITLLWKQYQKKQQQQHQAKILQIKQQNDIDLNRARLQFFTNISHEFRTPLTLIISPLETMMQSQRYNPADRKQFEIIHRNAERLLRMVNEIMDLRKIDNNKMQFNPENADIVAFLNEIYENFKILSEKRETELTFNSDFETLNINFDKEKIDKVMYNLLSNAFKFTPKNGKISLSIKNSDPNIAIIVKDSGCGIAQENINKIFDRFFQGNNSDMQQGTGIGLWLTKRFVEMHNGEINVTSQQGIGTTFTILLNPKTIVADKTEPKQYQHLTPDNVAENNATQPTDTLQLIDNKEHKFNILIVEDNVEIRQYLTEDLSNRYNIDTATNGEEAIENINKNMPDLVITDVMMPIMDGNQLCKKIKTDIETCHIPVIMLTAKSDIDQKIEGLENGADSYITKPFNPKHLEVRIEKLLELRKTLKEKFSSDITFNAEDTAISIPDRDLLKKTTAIIKKRISDTNLSVETLSSELGISRGHLQRKLKNLTGQNPNEFIRIIRLKQAAEILKSNDVSIAEVADMVGFGSQSYFSTAFTKQFNISPKQWKENKGTA